jgi:hypothetical protein
MRGKNSRKLFRNEIIYYDDRAELIWISANIVTIYFGENFCINYFYRNIQKFRAVSYFHGKGEHIFVSNLTIKHT